MNGQQPGQSGFPGQPGHPGGQQGFPGWTGFPGAPGQPQGQGGQPPQGGQQGGQPQPGPGAFPGQPGAFPGQPGPQNQPAPQNQPGPQGQPGPQNQPGPQGQPGPQNQPGPQGQPGPQNQPGTPDESTRRVQPAQQPGPGEESTRRVQTGPGQGFPGQGGGFPPNPPAAPGYPHPPEQPLPGYPPQPGQRPLSVVVAGGGTAGHVEPALALADAVRRIRPDARITALGTERGLENRLVPARGYPLELVPPVPMPRKPSTELLKLPMKVRESVRQTKEILDRVQADVVVGFGGYVSLPAYLAARGKVPIVVHEANARAGMANKVGARFAERVLTATPDSGLAMGRPIGIPLRESITGLDRMSLRAQARKFFGLHPHAPTILVFGGSQGAQTLNTAFSGAAQALGRAGVGVLHAHGPKNTLAVQQVPGAPSYVAVPYLERMDLAYAAADLVVCRSGAMTVAEVSAVGLPAVFVPLPHGNGEQALNAQPVVSAGGAVLVSDEAMTPEKVAEEILPLSRDPQRLQMMSRATLGSGHREADQVLARIVLEVAGQ